MLDLLAGLTARQSIGLILSREVCNQFCSVLQGFMVKVVSSKYNTENWFLEEETLAVAHQAGMYYSLAWRVFYAFGLTVRMMLLLVLFAHCR